MAWYVFPEDVKQHPAPDFRLRSSQGRPISLADYRMRSNQVLFFSHGMDCAACQRSLKMFSERQADYQAQTAEVLAFLPGTLDEPPPSSRSGILLLTDPEDKTRRAYADLLPSAGDDSVLIFVLDRYGAPYAALDCPEADTLAFQQDLLEWLAFIELQCPE